MSVLGPTFSQIKAQVAAIRRKLPDARVIGIRAPGRWTGEGIKRDGEEIYRISQCDSPLAMRIALREDGESTATKVLITSLDTRELSDDILGATGQAASLSRRLVADRQVTFSGPCD